MYAKVFSEPQVPISPNENGNENRREQSESEKLDLKLQSFQEFQRSGRSCWLVFAFNCIFCGLYCPYYFIEQYYLRDPSKTYLHFRFLQIIFLSVAILSGWIVLVLFHTNDTTLLQRRHRIKSLFAVSLTLFFSFNSFSHLFRYSIHAFDSTFELVAGDGDKCGIEFAYASLLLLLLIPVAAVEIFRETNQYTIFCVWLIIFLTFLFFAIFRTDLTSLLLAAVFLFMSILVMLDRYSFEWSVFEYNSKLELQIEKYTMERRATEMRDMIGNVAHDLKTVSKSLFLFLHFFV